MLLLLLRRRRCAAYSVKLRQRALKDEGGRYLVHRRPVVLVGKHKQLTEELGIVGRELLVPQKNR